MGLMLCIEFPKRRLELIFKMRSLRVLEDNIGVKTEGFILRDDFYRFSLFLSLPSSLLCIGEYLSQHIVLLNGLFSINIYLGYSLFEIGDQKALFLILSYYISYIVIFKESLACGHWSLGDSFYWSNLLQGIVKLINELLSEISIH
jgi:hypothetical protein